MARKIALIADLGEAFGAYRIGDDEALLDLLTAANVACGFHAGDPHVMHATVAACAARGVAVGAHPGFRDLVGFGRRTIEMSADEVRDEVLYQLGALSAFARAHGVPITHVTPHGRLGNLCVTDPEYSRGVLDAVAAFDPGMPVVVQAGELQRQARERGLPVAVIGLADRAYNPDGTLVSRRLPGAVIHDPDAIVERVARIVEQGTVVATDGTVLEVPCDAVLIHGDTPGAIDLARRVRADLVARGVEPTTIAEAMAAGVPA